MHQTKILTLGLVLTMLFACGGSKSESSGSTAAVGQLQITIDSTADAGSVKGYVVGSESSLSLESAGGNTYVVNNVPSGSVDVIVTGTLAIETSLASKDLGTRLNDIEVVQGTTTSKTGVTLPEVGSITGKVKLVSQTDHAGIDVYIPGTDYIAKTASDGSFTISKVPVGTHNLYMEKDGYHRGQTEGIEVKEATATTIDNVSLIISTGAEGFITLADGSSTVTSMTAELIIVATEDAVLMQISESETFTDISWEPLKTTKSYTFSADGERKIYVKFADANGLESSPISKTINVSPDAWSTLAKSGVPDGQNSYSLIDASTHFYAYGGNESFTSLTPVNKGYKYNLSSASWTAMSTTSAPVARINPSTAWTGTKLFVWGGQSSDYLSRLATGALYTEATDSWAAIADGPSGSARSAAPAVYAESAGKILVWGGLGSGGTAVADGYAYSVSGNTWSAMSTTNQPAARESHVAIWTGSKLIIWGGKAWPNILNSGALYDPSTDTWTTMSTTNAPAGRINFSAVWTGSKLVVWGGDNDSSGGTSSYYSDGAIYDLSANTWTALPTAGATSGRTKHRAAWTGTKMVIWGGNTATTTSSNTGGIYNLSTNKWEYLPSSDAPGARFGHFMGWDGTHVVVWGGTSAGSMTSSYNGNIELFRP